MKFSAESYDGYIDNVSAYAVSGWADRDQQPDEVAIRLNGNHLAALTGGRYRPDLREAGRSPEAGFRFIFERPLIEGDTVEILASNGLPLKNSPWVFRDRTYQAEKGLKGEAPNTLLFNHIPKTGGMSLLRVVDTYTPQRTILYQGQLDNRDFIENFRAKPMPPIIYGHFSYGAHRTLGVSPQYATVLRDPVARVVSVYRYNRSLSTSSMFNRDTGNMDLRHLIESHRTEETNNHMCRIIAGVSNDQGMCITSNWLLDLAKHNIRTHYARVGTLEDINTFLHWLADKLNWDYVSFPLENVTEGPSINIDSNTLRTINHYNALDIDLYNWARDASFC